MHEKLPMSNRRSFFEYIVDTYAQCANSAIITAKLFKPMDLTSWLSIATRSPMEATYRLAKKNAAANATGTHLRRDAKAPEASITACAAEASMVIFK